MESRVSTKQRRKKPQSGQFLAVPVLALVSAMLYARASTELVGSEFRFEHVRRDSFPGASGRPRCSWEVRFVFLSSVKGPPPSSLEQCMCPCCAAKQDLGASSLAGSLCEINVTELTSTFVLSKRQAVISPVPFRSLGCMFHSALFFTAPSAGFGTRFRSLLSAGRTSPVSVSRLVQRGWRSLRNAFNNWPTDVR